MKRVKIVEPGSTYESYESAAVSLNLSNWARGSAPSGEGTIISETLHPNENIPIYGFRDSSGREFIVNENAFVSIEPTIPFQFT